MLERPHSLYVSLWLSCWVVLLQNVQGQSQRSRSQGQTSRSQRIVSNVSAAEWRNV